MRPVIDLSDAKIRTAGGRVLFDGLTLRLSRERVALVGRNGVGKSTLLAVVAESNPRCHVVPQALAAGGASHGELRRGALAEAQSSGAEALLLDEPTEDLDDAGVEWLRAWLMKWPRALVVVSHDRRLLADFRHFFIASESGCRYFAGTLAELDAELDRDHRTNEERYASNLRRLVEYEEHTNWVARRRARKKQYGRSRELDRGTPPIRLNQKRSSAQVTHGREKRMREARLGAMREWSKSTRRALKVDLSVDLPVPALPPTTSDVIVVRGVLDRELRLRRERIAVVGPNGAGKTTLIDVMLGHRPPRAGTAWRDLSRIGVIEQGGANWMIDESLLSLVGSADDLARHRFPLALARRPLRSLSPGERARAALICLLRRAPEMLVLDEPTYSLDLVAQHAMTEALRAWPGGLVVASHDRAFLEAIGVDDVIELG